MNQDLKKLILFNNRLKAGVTLADSVRYETLSEDRIGKNILISEGSEESGEVITNILSIYPEVELDPENLTKELVEASLDDVIWRAVSEIKEGNTTRIADLFSFLETGLTNSTRDTQGLIIDFLDSFQMLFVNWEIPFNLIDPVLLPQTLILWKDIDRFWNAVAEWKKSHPELASPNSDEKYLVALRRALEE